RAAVGRGARRASCRRDGRLLAETTTLPHVPRADRRHVAGAPGLVVSVLGQPGGLAERGGPELAPTPPTFADAPGNPGRGSPPRRTLGSSARRRRVARGVGRGRRRRRSARARSRSAA